MSAQNDGGPAFPVASERNANGDFQWGCNGMTLRDWFAGQALAGFNAQSDGDYSYVWENAKGEKRHLGHGATPVAKDAEGWHIIKTPKEAMAEAMYAQADAMLAAREVTQ